MNSKLVVVGVAVAALSGGVIASCSSGASGGVVAMRVRVHQGSSAVPRGSVNRHLKAG